MFYFRLHVYCFVVCIELYSAGIKRKSGNSKQYVEIMMNVNVIGNYFLYFPKAWQIILVDSWVQERLGNDGRKLPDFQRNLSILPDACVKMRAISKSYWRLQPMSLMSWCFLYVGWLKPIEPCVFQMQHKQMWSIYAFPQLESHDLKVLLYNRGASKSRFAILIREDQEALLPCHLQKGKVHFHSKIQLSCVLACSSHSDVGKAYVE